MNQTSIFRLRWQRIAVLSLLLLALPRLAAAQTTPDSTRVQYSEETVPESEPIRTPLGQTYSKLARLQTEEQVLWKIGLNNFLPGIDYARFGGHLLYEQKLRPNMSLMAELSPDFTRRQRFDGGRQRHFSVRTQLAGRYYYNLSQRIRKGKSASNFSANYLSVAVGNGFGRHSRETPFYIYDFSKPFVRADMAVLYGLQRRLGPYGFVDFNVGFSSRLIPEVDAFGFAATLRIGLALGR